LIQQLDARKALRDRRARLLLSPLGETALVAAGRGLLAELDLPQHVHVVLDVLRKAGASYDRELWQAFSGFLQLAGS